MTSTQTITAPADTAPNAPETGRPETCVRASTALGRAERQLAMLQELAEIGMSLARAVERQAVAQADAGDPRGDLAKAGMVFARVARAVRQTLVLETRVDEERLAAEEKNQGERAAERAAEAQHAAAVHAQRRMRRKKIIEHAVERAISTEVGRDDAVDVHEELRDRLSDYEEFVDFANDPIGAIVGRICRDLGLTPDLSLWATEPWALEEMETKPPGSPFADWEMDDDEPDDADQVARPGQGRGPP